MVIIILIKLLFSEDVALWFPKSLLRQPKSRQNSCLGCFATVCGEKQQNVIRRKQELKGKGNLKKNTNQDSFSSGLLSIGCEALLEMKQDGPLSPHSLRHPLETNPQACGHESHQKYLCKLFLYHHQGKIMCSMEQILPMCTIHTSSYHDDKHITCLLFL